MQEKAQSVVDAIKSDIYSLDSKINLLTQKIKTIEKNEEIIGRTLITFNERLKDVEKQGGGQQSQRTDQNQGQDIEDLKKQLNDLKKNLAELKYVIDSINPLEYASIDQVKELLQEKMAKKA